MLVIESSFGGVPSGSLALELCSGGSSRRPSLFMTCLSAPWTCSRSCTTASENLLGCQSSTPSIIVMAMGHIL